MPILTSMKISRFLMIVGFVMYAVAIFYMPITHALHTQLSDKFIWGFAGAGLMYVFITMVIRFFLLRKEDIPNHPLSRKTIVLLALVALLAGGIIWGLYSIG